MKNKLSAEDAPIPWTDYSYDQGPGWADTLKFIFAGLPVTLLLDFVRDSYSHLANQITGKNRTSVSLTVIKK